MEMLADSSLKRKLRGNPQRKSAFDAVELDEAAKRSQAETDTCSSESSDKLSIQSG